MSAPDAAVLTLSSRVLVRKRIAQSESFSTRDAAGRFAAYLVESGYDHIVIQAEQVPG